MYKLKYNDIINNDCLLCYDLCKKTTFQNKIKNLKKKYSNLLEEFTYFDGYAFSSSKFVTRFKDLKNKIPLIQIKNINSYEWSLNNNDKFEYLPQKYEKHYQKYLLQNKNYVLLSLTGGSDTAQDISTYFNGNFKVFLNQRVSAYYHINNNKELLLYFYAFTKSKFFKEQFYGKGGVQKNVNLKEKQNLFIPKVDNNTIKYISLLTQAIINKEIEIRKKHNLILEKIEEELKQNQKPNKFKFSFPKFGEIKNIIRLDTGLYTKEFKEIDFMIKNYKNGYKNIYQLGFILSRGQNLQVSNIGKSIYSKKYYSNFYTLILPTEISKYGIVNNYIYLGNKKQLKTFNYGEIIFGAEGTYRSVVVCEKKEKYITNIHGITLYNSNLILSIFIKCFLDFLRLKFFLQALATGGHGGSLAQKYWDIIPFPNFPEPKQKEIAVLYHNPEAKYDISQMDLNNFLEKDNEFNKKAGIYELDKNMKYLKNLLNNAIEKIANDSGE